MAAEATVQATTAAPRYAPVDPTLPEPWKALVDGNTGYIYYWNTQTNVTQYERPPNPQFTPPPPPPGPPPGTESFRIDSKYQQPGRSDSLNSSIMHDSHRVSFAQPQHALGHDQLQHSSSGHTSVACTSSGLVPSSNLHKHGLEDQNYSFHEHKRQKRDHSSGTLPSAIDVESYRREHELSALGENVPAPFMTFEAAGLPPEILRELHNAGFSSPTPIQAQSWPVALQNRDIVAIAKTGSGKTLGYLLPGFLHLKSCCNNPLRGPTVLVLAPTRELATQIQSEAVKFGRSSRITSACVYGGAPKGPQLRELERGVDIVVATPGRLNDFLEARKVNLRQVSFLVLDEADRMLDMGFEPQIRKIVNEIPPRRQTLMYTATWPKEVRKIANDLLIDPVQVNIGNTDELSANKSITQYVEVIQSFEKQRRLEQILRSHEPGTKILVFCTTKKTCDQLARSLARSFGADSIHGDKSQPERDYVLSQFKTGKSPVLVATDVAARGLDIKDVRVVINFDFPTGIEDYVHRIGRTGRAGATGLAYTFFCDQDAKYSRDLIKLLEGADQKVPQELRDMVFHFGSSKGRGGRWDSGSHGGRDRMRGGRGNNGYSNGHLGPAGARGSGWRPEPLRYDAKERAYSKHGAHGRVENDPYDRYESYHGRHNRDSRGRHDRDVHQRHYTGTEAPRGMPHRLDGQDRGYIYSHSRSRSRSRSRGRSYGISHGRSCSRSRSRSPVYDRYVVKTNDYRSVSSMNNRRQSSLNVASTERDPLPMRNGLDPRAGSPQRGSSAHKGVPTYDGGSHSHKRSPHRNELPSISPCHYEDVPYSKSSPRSRH